MKAQPEDFDYLNQVKSFIILGTVLIFRSYQDVVEAILNKLIQC